ncbi:class I SAM-dependent methyltransferase [Bacillus sp. B1-b2]|uniref:class I SAM-dependent methyltransferase n=1 Tax=Bacillus sp. B1-b2 TaxID=2653201 RepID=UPI0012619DF4|nr:class I SAM-dependent methyltransferase [Bacillus sp. B1-b2]KAB7666434.1 class I SAM-dependent methyltransferase [Bacillus sp. B1-b2]
MEHRGSSAYDQEDFLLRYLSRREREDSPNNAIEGPIIFDLLKDFRGKDILDLGCGDGHFGKELLTNGAGSYVGIEGSEKMVHVARNNVTNLNGFIHHDTMESYQFPVNRYDVVASRMAIHYVSDIFSLFSEIHTTLKENGNFIFSVQHPLTTSSFLSTQSGSKRENWIVDDYFMEGERKEPWIGSIVVKYHRTIEQYFTTLTKVGFTINHLREGVPKREYFTNEDEYNRRLRIPLVLVFSCSKQ